MSATALGHIRVLDFTRVLAGPYCTMTLADLGAEVIKIEEPERGDDTRGFQISESLGISTYFLAANRNKQSVAIDLRNEEGRELVLRMVPKADVVVENFRSGLMERRGLGYDALAAINPALVFCSISGYGREGPLKDRPGYDPIVQAESGFMALTGEADGPPIRTGVSIIDIITGMFAAQAILAALLARQQTGTGQRIDVPLFDTGVNMMLHGATAFLVDGLVLGRPGNGNLLAAPVGLFETADGQIMVAMTTDRMYHRFCETILERPDLIADPRFADNPSRVRHKHVLDAEINRIFAGDSRDNWVAKLRQEGIPAGIVNDPGQALSSSDVADRGLITRSPHATAGSVPGIASPMHLSRTPVREPVGAPVLGQHTAEVLARLADCDDARIAALNQAGVINVWKAATE